MDTNEYIVKELHVTADPMDEVTVDEYEYVRAFGTWCLWKNHRFTNRQEADRFMADFQRPGHRVIMRVAVPN